MKNVKSKLLRILEEIESSVRSDMVTAETNEIAANEAAAEVKLNLDVENRFLRNQILSFRKQVQTVEVQLQNVERDWSDCQTSYAAFETAYKDAKKELEDANGSHEAGLQKLSDELALFQEVQFLYESQVASAGEEYKARTEDYADDQSFNSGQEFGKRSVYDVMNGTTAAEIVLAERKNN